MYCPKCRYVFADHLTVCPKCNGDFAAARETANISWLTQSGFNWLNSPQLREERAKQNETDMVLDELSGASATAPRSERDATTGVLFEVVTDEEDEDEVIPLVDTAEEENPAVFVEDIEEIEEIDFAPEAGVESVGEADLKPAIPAETRSEEELLDLFEPEQAETSVEPASVLLEEEPTGERALKPEDIVLGEPEVERKEMDSVAEGKIGPTLSETPGGESGMKPFDPAADVLMTDLEGENTHPEEAEEMFFVPSVSIADIEETREDDLFSPGEKFTPTPSPSNDEAASQPLSTDEALFTDEELSALMTSSGSKEEPVLRSTSQRADDLFGTPVEASSPEPFGKEREEEPDDLFAGPETPTAAKSASVSLNEDVDALFGDLESSDVAPQNEAFLAPGPETVSPETDTGLDDLEGELAAAPAESAPRETPSGGKQPEQDDLMKELDELLGVGGFDLDTPASEGGPADKEDIDLSDISLEDLDLDKL